MIKRLFTPPKNSSFFLFGPRGTGKTTWLKQHYPDALWIDFLNIDEELAFSMRPELLKDRLKSQADKKIIILDEVQKVPKILDVVHSLIESKQGFQFILTASSSRKLKRKGVNLLAGRAILQHFHPFVGAELKEEFDLEKALVTGMIPLVWMSDSPQETLNTYVNLYIQEEVKEEALVRDIGDFTRFLSAMSYSHGSLLNVTNISRECMVPKRTVDSYIEILQDLLLGFTIDIFTKRAKRTLITHAKFYFFDPGVFRILRKKGFLDASSELDGLALEGLVAEQLRFLIRKEESHHDLYFWRTKSGVEVDFIVYGANYFIGFEIKNNTNISPKDLRGLKEFQKDYPEASLFLVYRGKHKLMQDAVLYIPANEFLTLSSFKQLTKN